MCKYQNITYTTSVIYLTNFAPKRTDIFRIEFMKYKAAAWRSESFHQSLFRVLNTIIVKRECESPCRWG